MTEIVYVERDTDGAIKGVYANEQPGYAEEQLPADDPEVVAFLNPPPVPPGPTADQEAARANQRLDDGVTAAVAALPPSDRALLPAMLMPACSVYSSIAQSIPANTPTKINFDTAEYDVTSAFDLGNNRFQPIVAGYYQVNCGCGVEAGAVQNFTSIYKNDVEYRRSTTSNEGGNTRLSTLVHLNGSTDYVEGFVRINKAFNTIPGGILTSFSSALVQPEAPYAMQADLDVLSDTLKAMLQAHAGVQSPLVIGDFLAKRHKKRSRSPGP